MKEELVVGPTDAVVQPATMMIEIIDATIAGAAVLRSV